MDTQVCSNHVEKNHVEKNHVEFAPQNGWPSVSLRWLRKKLCVQLIPLMEAAPDPLVNLAFLHPDEVGDVAQVFLVDAVVRFFLHLQGYGSLPEKENISRWRQFNWPATCRAVW